MERDDRAQLKSLLADVSAWIAGAKSLLAGRRRIEESAGHAVEEIRRTRIDAVRGHDAQWRVFPLRDRDRDRLSALATAKALRPLPAGEVAVLEQLVGPTAVAVHDVKATIGMTRAFRGAKSRAKGEVAGRYLRDFHAWATEVGLTSSLGARAAEVHEVGEVDLSGALTDRTGLREQLAHWGGDVQLVDGRPLVALAQAMPSINAAMLDEARIVDAVRSSAETVRHAETRKLLVEMPIARLKEATGDRLRLGSLTGAGITTVQQVLDAGSTLRSLPGVGDVTATRMAGAARALQQAAYDDMPVRIDITSRTTEATTLLRRLNAWSATRSLGKSPLETALVETLRPVAKSLDPSVRYLIVVAGESSATEFTHGVETLLRRAAALTQKPTSGPTDPWDDFLSRPADYYAMLSELGYLTEDDAKSHGDLPDEIVEAIRATELDTEHLDASLRGYQSFGARFALSQRKVIIGDEMGLGKTVEALAVLTHLRAKGGHHFLVVCPAAVVTNWVREVGSKSQLHAHRVHGPGRDQAAVSWMRAGGVAVTTYETLAWFEARVHQVKEVACVVVDEAHYIKNPAAQRSRRAARLIEEAPRAVLLTGTPLENRIDEFRNLVRYLRPDLVVDDNGLSARRFRQQVAPAYLRRNQEDVLTELPELVEVDEWLPMSREDSAAYRDAVMASHFARMRQATLLTGPNSEKLRRLVEVVTEAEENGRRVIVFSHFLAVLEEARRALPGRVFGPLTGSVPAAARQTMVDEFSKSRHGSVLVAQIIAGGVGLNIQAASVVIICEPQLKPTTEWQAIARAHRMGQLETVQVHRLLSEEGVDVRVTEILARKSAIFAEFARISETAESAPEALDISEAELSREVVAAERERLFAAQAEAVAVEPDTGSTRMPDPSQEQPEGCAEHQH